MKTLAGLVALEALNLKLQLSRFKENTIDTMWLDGSESQQGRRSV